MADKVERAEFDTELPRRFVEVRSGEFAPEVYGIAALTGPGDKVGRASFDEAIKRRFVEVRPGEFAPEVVVVGLEGGGALTPDTPGPFLLLSFDIGWDTPNIDTGASLYTPTIGDRLLGAWVETTEAFDTSTSLMIGTAGALADGDYSTGGALSLSELFVDPSGSTAFGGGRFGGTAFSPAAALTTSSVLVKTNIGGDTTGLCTLFVVIAPAAGIDGAANLVGPRGPQGASGGEQGDTGPQGPQGLQGPQGDPGSDGSDGINGSDGEDGADGADGTIITDRLHLWSKIIPAFQFFDQGVAQNLEWRTGTIADGAAAALSSPDGDGNSETVAITAAGDYDLLLRFDLQPAHGTDFVQIEPIVTGYLGGDKFLQNFPLLGSWDWNPRFFWRMRLDAGATVKFQCTINGGTDTEEVGDGSLDVCRTK